MKRKIFFGLLWLGFVGYAFLFAPSGTEGTWELIKNLSLGQWKEINPLVVALFNLMGILPLMYACVLLIDGNGQKLPSWPFAIGSFAVGAFAIIPYLALRETNEQFYGEKKGLIKLIDSRLTGVLITLSSVILLSYGFSKGDWINFFEQWQTSRFINVMSLDFCLLCLLFPTLVKDDLVKRKVRNPVILLSIAFFPFLGGLLYLCLRPPLSVVSDQ